MDMCGNERDELRCFHLISPPVGDAFIPAAAAGANVGTLSQNKSQTCSLDAISHEAQLGV